MSADWCNPVTVGFGAGRWGLGTVRGGPFAADETYEVSGAFGPRTSFFIPKADGDSWGWVNGVNVRGFWTGNWHGGTDFACPLGTALGALGECVAEIGYEPDGYGHYFRGRRADGFTFLYAHMREPSPFASGDVVAQGTVVGFVGSTGKSSGPHLHMEIGLASNFDPLPFMLGARDVGEPLPVPAPAIGDPVPFISMQQSTEIQYVLGGKVIVLPGQYEISQEDYILYVYGKPPELIPAGTPMRGYRVLATAMQ